MPVQPPNLCAGRDLSSCEFDGQCSLESWACPAVCIDDGDSGCRPCDAPPAACVPVVATLPVDGSCSDRNLFACNSDPRCQLESVCAAVCIGDGDGGCAPCPATCVARASCDGLDLTSCEAAQATFFACTAECRDDGDGGCLPCDSGFVCSGGSSVGAVDGGSDASATTPSVTDLLGDPLFEDAALRVTALSPAVNAGTSTSAPVTALGGTARPQGAAVDIGAYER